MFTSEKLFEWEVVLILLEKKTHLKKIIKTFTDVLMVVRIDAFET